MLELREFDRTADVSKLDGCNTRNLEYRWDLFTRELADVPRGSEALDFGAGSLRDSFELMQRGYNVTSVDLNSDLMSSYQTGYDWPDNGTTRTMVTGQDLASCFSQIDNKRFSLIICFDVLEHLEDPTLVLRQMRVLLAPGGRLLVTVPNGRTLIELWFWLILVSGRMLGRKFRPGGPHLQRNSPKKWQKILNDAGFDVLRHDMEIGFFVNTVWALVQIPVYTFGRLVQAIGFNFPTDKILDTICGKKMMASLDKIDGSTKSYFSGLYGWNLFVAAPS
jgi:2-polyprenyl-3-methyl-5-hydroxy-6-metoxy-1,4-benzoquinol methylase